MDDFELMCRQRGDKPSKYRLKKVSGMLRGKTIRGHDEDNASTHDGWPPGAQPTIRLCPPQAGLHFRQLRCGARVAPGFRHASILQMQKASELCSSLYSIW